MRQVLLMSSNYEFRIKEVKFYATPPKVMHFFSLSFWFQSHRFYFLQIFFIVMKDRNSFMQLINASWDTYIIAGPQTIGIQGLAMLHWIISFKVEQPSKQAQNLITQKHKSKVQPHLELLCAVLIAQSPTIQSMIGKDWEQGDKDAQKPGTILFFF